MKKVILLLLVCFMALGAKLAMADTRTDSLGLIAGDQIDDLDSIWLFPQDAANFGNVADFRIGALGADSSWGGVIDKVWDDIGYFAVYTGRPFNQSNGVTPNTPAADQNGILNGSFHWWQLSNPANSSYWGENFLSDPDESLQNHYSYWPDGEVALNYWANQQGWEYNILKVADPQNLADIFWAKDFSDVTLGAHLNYAAQNGGNPYGDNYGSGTGTFNEPTNTEPYTTATAFNLTSQILGLDLGITFKSLGLGLGVGYSLGTVNYSETYTGYYDVGSSEAYNNVSIKDNNISEARLNALLKSKVSDTTTTRVFLNARMDNLGFKQSEVGDYDADDSLTDAGDVYSGTSTYTDTNLNLGIAVDNNVADGKAHVIGSLNLILDSRKWTQTALDNTQGSSEATQVLQGSGSSYTETWWDLPANIAVEAPLTSWLKARIGASHDLFNDIQGKIVQLTDPSINGTAFKDTTTVTEGWNLATIVDMSYGLSAEFQNFTLDLQINPNTFQNYLSGFQPGAGVLYNSNSVADFFTQADMRYAF